MKIFTTSQIRKADQYTIKNEPISSIDLMERAASECSNWIIKKFITKKKVKILVGPGNNGGDGLAIARQLAEKNYKIECYILHISKKTSDDNAINLSRLKKYKKVKIINIGDKNDFPFIKQSDIVVDSLFGSGLKSSLRGLAKNLVEYLNKKEATKIAIDIPSGLNTDIVNNQQDVVFEANYTLSFQFMKYSFLFVEAEMKVGEVQILDIGLSDEFISLEKSDKFFVTDDFVSKIIKKRSKFSHKGNFGHVLLISGSYGKIGATVLSAKAIMRAGAGLLTVYAPYCAYNILQTAVPEAMMITDENETNISKLPKIENYDAIGVGPGIDKKKETANKIKELLQKAKQPLVIDADAINIIAENNWQKFLPQNSIITPHEKEFERLFSKTVSREEKIALQKKKSKELQIIIVLKGIYTTTSTPDGTVYFNSTGNSGMATAGSGDLLTGVITALLGQNYKPKEAAILGVYLHGKAGDKAAAKKSKESIIASDIVSELFC